MIVFIPSVQSFPPLKICSSEVFQIQIIKTSSPGSIEVNTTHVIEKTLTRNISSGLYREGWKLLNCDENPYFDIEVDSTTDIIA